MSSRLALSAVLALALAGPALAQMNLPGGGVLDEGAEGIDGMFGRNLVSLSEDRDRAIAGQIDGNGYLRTNLDGMPVEVLEGLRPLGAQIVPLGQDPSNPMRTIREVRFSDKALTKIPGNRFQPRDHIEMTVAVDQGRRLTLLKTKFSNGLYVPPETAAKP